MNICRRLYVYLQICQELPGGLHRMTGEIDHRCEEIRFQGYRRIPESSRLGALGVRIIQGLQGRIIDVLRGIRDLRSMASEDRIANDTFHIVLMTLPARIASVDAVSNLAFVLGLGLPLPHLWLSARHENISNFLDVMICITYSQHQ